MQDEQLREWQVGNGSFLKVLLTWTLFLRRLAVTSWGWTIDSTSWLVVIGTGSPLKQMNGIVAGTFF